MKAVTLDSLGKTMQKKEVPMVRNSRTNWILPSAKTV